MMFVELLEDLFSVLRQINEFGFNDYFYEARHFLGLVSSMFCSARVSMLRLMCVYHIYNRNSFRNYNFSHHAY